MDVYTQRPSATDDAGCQYFFPSQNKARESSKGQSTTLSMHAYVLATDNPIISLSCAPQSS